MKSYLYTILSLALLHIAISVPCIGDSCGRLLKLYSVYEDEDGVFYIQEGSHNSASSINDDKNEQAKKEYTYQLQELQHPNLQRLTKNYQQRVESITPGQGPYQSNQQSYVSSTAYDENQETQYEPNTGLTNQGNYKSSRNQGGHGGHYQTNYVGSKGQYPGSGNQGDGGDHYQNNSDDFYGHYPGSDNQGAVGGDYYQNNGGYHGRYPDGDSSCPNCYATNFGNGDYNNNIINIEK